MPSTVAKSVPSPTSSTVGGSRDADDRGDGLARAQRDAEVAGERGPQVGHVLLRRAARPDPYSLRCSATSAGVRRSLRASSATGSPGITRNRKKLNVRTKNSVHERVERLAAPRTAASHRSLPAQADPACAHASSSTPRRRRTAAATTAPIATITEREPQPRRQPCRGAGRAGARDEDAARQRVVVVPGEQVAVRARRRDPAGEPVVAVGLEPARVREHDAGDVVVEVAAAPPARPSGASARSMMPRCSS